MFVYVYWATNCSVFLYLFALESVGVIRAVGNISELHFAHAQTVCHRVRGSSSLTGIMQEIRAIHSLSSSSSDLNPFEHVSLLLPLNMWYGKHYQCFFLSQCIRLPCLSTPTPTPNTPPSLFLFTHVSNLVLSFSYLQPALVTRFDLAYPGVTTANYMASFI